MSFRKIFTIILPAICISLFSCGTPSDQETDSDSENTYEIIWKNYDGTVLETDSNVAKNSMPSFDGETPIRPSDDQFAYTWTGWTPNVGRVTGNQTYTATYSSEKLTTNYVVDFDLNGGTSPSYSGPKTVEEFSKDIFFFDCIKEEYNFRGWSYKGIKIFDEKGNQLANPTMEKNMTFVAMYSQTAKLTVFSNYEGAGIIGGEGEYSFNSFANISVTPNEGFVFVGWYYEENLVSSSMNYKYMLWNDDIILEARFKLKSYSLNIYTNNADNGLVLLKSLFNNDYLEKYQEYRDYTSEVTVAAYSKTNIKFLGWYDDENDLISTNEIYKFSMPNYNYNLEAKWDYFNISYSLDGGTNDLSNPTSYSSESTGLLLKNPTKLDYDFLGWQFNGNFVSEIDSSWLQNVELIAIWKEHFYSISYNLNGGENNPLNPTNYTIISNTITLKNPSKNGYTFDGWYNSSDFSNKVSQITSGSSGDITLYAKWELIDYSISYYLNGGENNPSNPYSYTIEDDINLCAPVRIGYTFIGWYSNDNVVTTIPSGSTGSIELEARWSANLNGLSVISEDTSKGSVSITSGRGYSGEQITVEATPVEDFYFRGWYHESINVSSCPTYTFTMPTNDYTLVAYFFTKAEKEQDLIRLGGIPTISNDLETITYGLYPQKNVNDAQLISELNSLENPESNGSYLYKDDYYVKLRAKPYWEDYRFDNGEFISNNATYWFKCEPIVWEVSKINNDEYFVVSSVILDAHYFNKKYIGKGISNNYKNSDIRKWLNEDFLKFAFMLDENHVQTTFVDNVGERTDYRGNTYNFESVEDKIFLISTNEYHSHTFDETGYTTDWARAKGVRCHFHNLKSDYYPNGWRPDENDGIYWFRSPDFQFLSGVEHNNYTCYYEYGTDLETEASVGVRPAFTFKNM